MALQARGRTPSNPREELAKWMGARQKHHSEYVKLLNDRKNEISNIELDHGSRSDIYLAAQRESSATISNSTGCRLGAPAHQ